MNELTKTGARGALTNTQMANPFAAAGAGAGSTTYMKYKGASGDFLYGQDDEEMPHGTQFAGDVENSKWVWSFWWEGEVLDTIETFVAADPLGYENEPEHLPEGYDGDMTLEEIREAQADRSTNFMDGWSVQAVLGLREIGGEGEEFTLRLNGGVAVNAFRSLLATFGRQFRFKEGLTPIIEIGARAYKSKNKSVGKRYAPTLKIVDWKSEEDLMADMGEDPGMYDEPDEAPKARTAPKTHELPPPADDEGEGDDEAPAPRGRGARGRRGQNYG